MTARQRLTLLVAVVGAASLLVCLPGRWRLTRANQDVTKDVQKIPLESVYSTNGQRGLKPMSAAFHPQKDGSRRFGEPYGRDLEEIRSEHEWGASNIFVVSGGDITAAVKAARRVLTGGQSADVPAVPDDGSTPAPFWVVCHLGVESSGPPAWLIQSVERRDRIVRITFSKPKRLFSTADIHQYFVWVPLGELGPGTYALELYDAEKREVTLLRRVAVAEK
jgi:hypothetical protein